MRKIVLTVALCLVCISTVSFGGLVIADAVSEFSGTQGQNNWYYGYYDGDSSNPFTPDDFELFNVFTSNHWYLNDAGYSYWTMIHWNHMHPNGPSTSGGRQPVEQWSVRRWVSEVDGVVTIYGNVARIQPSQGDGSLAHIFVDGQEVYMQYVGIYDFAGYSYQLNLAVNEGSIIDFAVSPGSNDIADGIIFNASIIPEPATLSLLALGGLVLRRKNNN